MTSFPKKSKTQIPGSTPRDISGAMFSKFLEKLLEMLLEQTQRTIPPENSKKNPLKNFL